MYVFLDIETTGLCEKEDYILEIAVAVFDGTNVTREMSVVIDPGETARPWANRMNEYVFSMHSGNGLLEAINSGEGSTLQEAEHAITDVIQEVSCQNGGKPIIAGNSIQFDRRFIHAKMPILDSMLSHRMLDCSTLKMFARSNWPELVEERVAETAHRALPDCHESIQTYRHYVERLNPRRYGAKARRA